MKSAATILTILLLASCSAVELTDSYGNEYGNYWDHGDQYQWQLAACQKETADRSIPAARAKSYMRCCMGRHGVPIEAAASCVAPPIG